MRKHRGTPSQRDKFVTLAAISPPSSARGCFVGGRQSGLAGCKPPTPLHARSLLLYVTAATPEGTLERLSRTESTYLPTYLPLQVVSRLLKTNQGGGCQDTGAGPWALEYAG